MPVKQFFNRLLGEITGALRESIRARLDEMLVPDTETRLPASRLLARWLDLFRVQAKRQNIHRHAASLQQGTFAKAPEEQPEKQAIPDDTPPKERSEEEAINEIQPPPTSTNPVDPSE